MGEWDPTEMITGMGCLQGRRAGLAAGGVLPPHAPARGLTPAFPAADRPRAGEKTGPVHCDGMTSLSALVTLCLGLESTPGRLDKLRLVTDFLTPSVPTKRPGRWHTSRVGRFPRPIRACSACAVCRPPGLRPCHP